MGEKASAATLVFNLKFYWGQSPQTPSNKGPHGPLLCVCYRPSRAYNIGPYGPSLRGLQAPKRCMILVLTHQYHRGPTGQDNSSRFYF